MKQPIIKTPEQEHRRQLIWQVWIPLGASILIILVVAGFSVAGAITKSDQIERWGNLSAIWIIAPGLLAALIFLGITIASIYGTSKLLAHMHSWLLKLHSGIVNAGLILRIVADRSTQPVMFVNDIQARTETLWKKLIGK